MPAEENSSLLNKQIDELTLQNELLSKENEILKAHLQEYFRARDILSSQDARKRLFESEMRYRSLVEGSPDMIAIFDNNDRLVFVNAAGYKYFGASSAEELMGRSRVEFVSDGEVDDFNRVKQEFTESDIHYVLTVRSLTDSRGYTRHFEILTIKTTYKGNPAIQLIARCIEDRLKMQYELEQSEKKFRSIFEGSPLGMGMSIDNKLFTVNKAYANIFGYSDPAEMIGKSVKELIAPQAMEKVSGELESRKQGEWKKSSYNMVGLKKDGSVFPAHIEVEPIELNGRVAAAGFITDMTEANEKEEKIIASLREKEIMLKEIHHRVKNNLQIISSLLSLQIDLIDEKNFMSAFLDSRDRVRTMAIIHEKLYQSGDFTAIEFSSYLEELVQYLLRTSCIDNQNIKIEMQLEEIKLNIDTAIPCGLIITELISNVFKHAFPGGGEGIINLCMKKEEGNIIIIVKDNGVGIPSEKNLKNAETLGIMLINSLVSQLKGCIKLETAGGTEFTVIIPN